MIGKIGPAGAIFGVGNSLTLIAPISGELFLGVNEIDYSDNMGAWTASISSPEQPDAPRDPAPPRRATEPQAVHLGDSQDRALAALGQPEKKIDLGSKKIWVYKDLKVTFLNGKVSDVQ
jgi:hypothetical protein